MVRKVKSKPFFTTREEVEASTTHKLAFADQDFLLRSELRPIRLQLELLKPELMLQDKQIESTIVFFGSARTPDPETAAMQLHEAEKNLASDPENPQLKRALKRAQNVAENSQYLREARNLARIISSAYGTKPGIDFVVTTGGGPSFMEAANRGANDVNARSVALNIMLPHEQEPNPYVSPDLTFQFHYFAIRKMHFFIRAHAMIAFPGGYGTFDELFDALTLIQTGKMERLPILLFSKRYWDRVINFEALVDEGTISEEDLLLFQFVETAEEAWQIILDFYEIK